jgi:hypothetical protein
MKKFQRILLPALILAVILAAGCKGGTSDAPIVDVPSIALFDVTGGGKVAVNPGDTVQFGTYHYGTPVPLTRNFSIENTGTAALNLTGSTGKVVVSGTDTADFTIPTPPPASIPAGGSASFDIVYEPLVFGASTRNAAIGIESDDPDLANATFNVAGDYAC